jgi:hypothetical protein
VLRVRPGKAPQVLRMIVAALLLFSFVRVLQPLASRSAGATPQVANHMTFTRSMVFEVSGGGAKLVRPTVLRFRAALISLAAPALGVLQLSLRSPFVRVWPEHRRSFFRRILPSASDSSH